MSYLHQDDRFPRYGSNSQNITISNNRRDRDNYLNSINNNISTSLSSYDKSNEKNKYYTYQQTRENNLLNFKERKRSRSRSPCCCGCHLNKEYCNSLEYNCIPVFHHDHFNTHYSNTNSIITKNEEMNKKNDDLLNEIINLKRDLKRVEDELKRAKTEKDSSDFYIKELEKELSKLNINNIIEGPKKREVNSLKMKNFGKYHDMLNKSFEVLDSVSNKCTDPNGKIKGDVNYYYDRDQDYNMVIDAQKNWLDSLPIYKANKKENSNIISTIKGIDSTGSNKFNNSDYPDVSNSKLNVFKYPNRYNNIEDENIENENNNPYYSNNNISKKSDIFPYYSNDINNFDNQNEKRKRNNNKINNSYPNQIKEKMNALINNKNKNNNIFIDENSNSNIPENNNNSFPNSKMNNIIEKDNIKKDRDINSYHQNKNKKGKNGNNKEEIESNDYENEKDKNQNKKENILKARYLVTDKNGDPIFLEGNRLFGMEILPIIGEDGKEELDKNGNIIFYGPDGELKTQDDLEPIILDNDLPLVNEENKPFLGINGIIMVNKYGNPILGPGELYDKDNQIVHGELGLFPKDNQGNLIKLNIKEDPLWKDENNDFNNNEDYNNESNYNNKNKYDDNNFDNNQDNYYDKNYKNNNEDNNNEDNNYNNENNIDNNSKNEDNNYNNKEIIYNNDDNKSSKYDNKDEDNFDNPKYSKKNKEKNNIPKNDFINKNNMNIKPLIGSDGRPVLDNKNNPIMLDNINNPIKGTGIQVLLDQSGKPLLNTIGEPILINKEGNPINLINENDEDNINNNYHKIKPDKKNKNKKNSNYYTNDNKEKRKFNNNLHNNDNNNEYKYPKPNPKYQRKLNYKPIDNSSYNPKEYSGSCFACDVGCAVSITGYSPMTYSPFNNRIKRREETPINIHENFE